MLQRRGWAQRGWAQRGLRAETSLPDSITPNLRSSIYCSAVATGGEEAWDFIWERFLEAPVVSEADKLRTALTCSTEPWILQRWVQGWGGPGSAPAASHLAAPPTQVPAVHP